ncbi:MAG: hypothetical protein KA994_01320, partial [Brachymonas sp.]|nr:hypothetical protein [Brachymonas sp.]
CISIASCNKLKLNYSLYCYYKRAHNCRCVRVGHGVLLMALGDGIKSQQMCAVIFAANVSSLFLAPQYAMYLIVNNCAGLHLPNALKSLQ